MRSEPCHGGRTVACPRPGAGLRGWRCDAAMIWPWRRCGAAMRKPLWWRCGPRGPRLRGGDAGRDDLALAAAMRGGNEPAFGAALLGSDELAFAAAMRDSDDLALAAALRGACAGFGAALQAACAGFGVALGGRDDLALPAALRGSDDLAFTMVMRGSDDLAFAMMVRGKGADPGSRYPRKAGAASGPLTARLVACHDTLPRCPPASADRARRRPPAAIRSSRARRQRPRSR